MRRLDEVLIFLHLPKTAGTTIVRMLEPNFEPPTIYDIDAHRQLESFERFARWPQQRRRTIRLVRGHMKFGFHQLLPTPSSYVTMLRHPVDRMISHYYEMVRRGPPNALHLAIKEHDLDVVEYACSRLSNQFDNHQIRMLIDAEDTPYGEMTRDHLREAVDILKRRFSVVGVQDHFDEFAVQLKKRFRLKTVDYVKRNVTWKRPAMRDLSKSDYRRILAENSLDMELYEHVKRQVQRRSRAWSFQFKLYCFRKRQAIKARREQARQQQQQQQQPEQRRAA